MEGLLEFLQFPKQFRFGTSVSSFQVEGSSGIRNSDWDVFLSQHPNIVKPNEVGPQWWKKPFAEKDIDRLAKLGMQSQRLSFEWARIEPEEGHINKESLTRYHEIIDCLLSRHITPVVTLNHYTLPEWIARKGSWNSIKTVDAFARYTELVVKEFSHITTWLTLNEPSVLVETAYFVPVLPPQHTGILSALNARMHMLEAHKRAYHIIKGALPSAKVSMAFAFRWYRPENPKDIFESTYAKLVDYIDSLNYVYGVKDYLDFIGVNYYAGYFLNLNLSKVHIQTRISVSTPPKTILFGEVRKPDAYESDLGMPIVPDFFLDLLRTLHNRFHKPIIITENGIADRRDYHRAFYVLTHLVALWKALQEGVDIQEYLVWASVDNLEWLEGYRQEFGLIHVDAVSGKRTIRNSANLYRDIIANCGIHIDTLLSEYLEGEQQEKAQELIHTLLGKL